MSFERWVLLQVEWSEYADKLSENAKPFEAVRFNGYRSYTSAEAKDNFKKRVHLIHLETHGKLYYSSKHIQKR